MSEVTTANVKSERFQPKGISPTCREYIRKGWSQYYKNFDSVVAGFAARLCHTDNRAAYKAEQLAKQRVRSPVAERSLSPISFQSGEKRVRELRSVSERKGDPLSDEESKVQEVFEISPQALLDTASAAQEAQAETALKVDQTILRRRSKKKYKKTSPKAALAAKRGIDAEGRGSSSIESRGGSKATKAAKKMGKKKPAQKSNKDDFFKQLAEAQEQIRKEEVAFRERQIKKAGPLTKAKIQRFEQSMDAVLAEELNRAVQNYTNIGLHEPLPTEMTTEGEKIHFAEIKDEVKEEYCRKIGAKLREIRDKQRAYALKLGPYIRAAETHFDLYFNDALLLDREENTGSFKSSDAVSSFVTSFGGEIFAGFADFIPFFFKKVIEEYRYSFEFSTFKRACWYAKASLRELMQFAAEGEYLDQELDGQKFCRILAKMLDLEEYGAEELFEKFQQLKDSHGRFKDFAYTFFHYVITLYKSTALTKEGSSQALMSDLILHWGNGITSQIKRLNFAEIMDKFNEAFAHINTCFEGEVAAYMLDSRLDEGRFDAKFDEVVVSIVKERRKEAFIKQLKEVFDTKEGERLLRQMDFDFDGSVDIYYPHKAASEIGKDRLRHMEGTNLKEASAEIGEKIGATNPEVLNFIAFLLRDPMGNDYVHSGKYGCQFRLFQDVQEHVDDLISNEVDSPEFDAALNSLLSNLGFDEEEIFEISSQARDFAQGDGTHEENMGRYFNGIKAKFQEPIDDQPE